MSIWKTLFAFVGWAVAGPVVGKVVDATITLLNNLQTRGLRVWCRRFGTSE